MKNWLIPPNFQFMIRIARGQVPRSKYMQFFRDLVGWTLPLEAQHLILNARYAMDGVDVSKNNGLRNRYKGQKRCFVVGNGPSLKGMDLSPLKDEFVVVCNSFYKHPDAEKVAPQFLCIADESFMEDKPNCVEWHRTIEEKLPATSLMLHPAIRPVLRKYNLYRQHDIHFYRHGITVNNPALVDYDFSRPLSVGHTCGSRLAIPLAVCLGFAEVYLLGFDCNWLDNFDGSYHFYESHDHFPEFDSLAADHLRHPRYADQLMFALRDFDSHTLIADSSPAFGTKVYNATRGGRLDMYPRVRFEDCFEAAR